MINDMSEILYKMKEKVAEKVGLTSSVPSTETGKGKSKLSKNVTHGYYCVKGKSHHPMEDYAFAQFRQIDGNELGLFAVFDGHMSQDVPDYLKSNLFDNILREPDFWTDTENAIKNAYHATDSIILDRSGDLGRGGSTAVTAILINCQKLVVANIGDSRAVICKNGKATQLSIDHEPDRERKDIEERGGFVSRFPGDVSRVDGRLAVARAFGDKSIKEHLSSDPDIATEMIDDDTEFAILASDGIWHVMDNQEAVDCVKTNNKDARSAAKHLIELALSRNSTDDISVIVVKFQ